MSEAKKIEHFEEIKVTQEQLDEAKKLIEGLETIDPAPKIKAFKKRLDELCDEYSAPDGRINRIIQNNLN